MQRNNEKNKRKKEKLLEIQETVPEVEKKERIHSTFFMDTVL